MARSFTKASSHKLSVNSAVVTAAPFSVSLWAYPAAFDTVQLALNLQSDANTDNWFIKLKAATGEARFFATSNGGATQGFAQSANTATVNTWTHIVAVETSSSSRSVRLNGGTAATDATAVTPASIDRTQVGAHVGGSDYHDGLLAEVGVWNAALDADEQIGLSKGICPLLIRPQSLVAYWPLFANDATEIDRWKNRYDLTVTGATKADHPRMYYPAGVV